MIGSGAAKLYVGAVARRIEIELTSARPDGTWTWRAAGALNPRGTVDASLLYSNARAGDVVRAEAEFGIDGITVVAVEPPRSPQTSDPNRIELLDRPAAAGVTTQLAGGRGRPGPTAPMIGVVNAQVHSSQARRRADPRPASRRPALTSSAPTPTARGHMGPLKVTVAAARLLRGRSGPREPSGNLAPKGREAGSDRCRAGAGRAATAGGACHPWW